jgi:hypothetical protein
MELRNMPVFDVEGRVVGQIEGCVLRKRVRASTGFLRRPRAIAWDRRIIEAARAAGVTDIEVEDIENYVIYRTDMDTFLAQSFLLDRGRGPQLAMPLECWYGGPQVGGQLPLPVASLVARN